MEKRRPRPAPRPVRGFVRHDLFLAAAALLLTLAVVVPQALKHGPRGALLALLGVAGILAAGAAILLAGFWLAERLGRPGGWRCVAGLLRFAGFGLAAAVLGAALVHGHGLSAAWEDRASLGCGALGGAAGVLLHLRLGPARFWPASRRLGYALLGSLACGILGILGPGDWGVDLGILLPLLVFAGLAAAGRIVPPPAPSGDGNQG